MPKKPEPWIDDAVRLKVSPRVRAAKRYDPVTSLQAIQNAPHLVHYKLDWNESTIEPSPKVFQALKQLLDCNSRIHWYPDICHEELYLKISEYVGLRTEQILVTNGSDDALTLICQTYLDAGDIVVAPFPTYKHFLQFAELAGARLRMVRRDNPFSVSLQDIEAAIDSRTKIVYLANPNNPTGILFQPSDIFRIAARHLHTLFLIDEAYYEFGGRSCTPIICSSPNIVVTRSFSKCFSLAGLRIGYVAAPEEIINNLRYVHNPKSINTMAQAAALAALDDLGYYKDYVAEVKQAALVTKRFCRAHGLPCKLTHANFVLLELEKPSLVASLLRDAGVHVRDRSSQLPGMIRLTLGTPEQMREVLSRLTKVLYECGELLRSVSAASKPESVFVQTNEKQASDNPTGAFSTAAL
ncbi:MAG: pyridoxal phosphate-dependent aminotransferase [Syntrophobacteraceae bacterium]